MNRMQPFSRLLAHTLPLLLLLTAEPAWAVENPKRMLMIFPAITVVILVIIILVTRKR